MKNNCSREIYDLLSKHFAIDKEKNLVELIEGGHRKFAVSIIDCMDESTVDSFLKLHYDVNQKFFRQADFHLICRFFVSMKKI